MSPVRLGAAATLLTLSITRAAAGDMTLAAPVALPALRACDGSMPGGFMLPGTEACLRIGGVLRADAGLRFASASTLAPPSFAWIGAAPTAPPSLTQTSTSFSAQARLSADLRTNTAYGPLRVFVSIRSDRRR